MNALEQVGVRAALNVIKNSVDRMLSEPPPTAEQMAENMRGSVRSFMDDMAAKGHVQQSGVGKCGLYTGHTTVKHHTRGRSPAHAVVIRWSNPGDNPPEIFVYRSNWRKAKRRIQNRIRNSMEAVMIPVRLTPIRPMEYIQISAVVTKDGIESKV